jgi:long-subunit acyl-CoA synthetase (AMP-forming)
MLDTVLVLPTAGTTGSPKQVPLTQANIDASVCAWIEALGLTRSDRCLNVMPIWHGALISNVLTSLSVGGVVMSVPRVVSPLHLWQLIDEFRPTWLPLPVDLAQKILGEEVISIKADALWQLRFVRLSKASLSPNELYELSCIFHCPILQSYGMTEAASGPVACETLVHRRPGSVGRPVHLEVKIDHDQVLIRGPSIMRGYVAGPPDAHTFVRDREDPQRGGFWLQTKDLGHFDEDGFLYLTGRLDL